MALSETGPITHCTRVEQWECDYNQHWNTRFYARSFGYAADYCLSLQGHAARPRPTLRKRHMRFHREMLVGSAITVHSGQLHRDPGAAGALVHYLYGNGRLSATAVDHLDAPLAPLPGLPVLREADCTDSAPRGLNAELEIKAQTGWFDRPAVPVLTLRPGDLDLDGTVLPEVLSRFAATASHRQLNALGLTREFSESTRINRMNAECRLTLGDPVPVGSLVFAQSRILSAAARHFVAAHRLTRADGQVIAVIELCLLAVHLDSRRVTEVPDFIRAAVD